MTLSSILKQTLPISLLITLAASCATMSPSALVIPRDNGQFETMGQGKSKLIAMSNAMQGVTQTCNAQHANPVVASEKIKYNGIINEQTGKVIEGVSKTLQTYTGIRPASVERDDDYDVTLTFYCKK